MPHHKAQEKSLKQDKVRRTRNSSLRARVLTLLKKAEASAKTDDTAATASAAKQAQSAIDIAAKKKSIHKNTASRRKSRLARATARKKKEEAAG